MKPPSLNRGVFGWDSCKLADNYSTQELTEAIQWIAHDPSCTNPAHANGTSICLLSPKAKKMSEQLAWAVFHQSQERRRAVA